jgi:SAM-dependent methyltransferase
LISQWNNTVKPDERFKKFWEMKALRYPLPFDKGTIEKTLSVISMAKAKGVEIQGKKILDIGCGTGIYTLPLARQAAHVTGLDSSETMIKRLKNEAENHHISNLDIIKESWKDMDIETMNLKKRFDIVWTSMSMAVKDKQDFIKMESCSLDWCVFIGWGRVNRNPIMEEAFRMHNIQHGPHPGAANAFAILRALGRSPVLEYFSDFWDWEGTLEEAVDDISGYIQMRGAAADRDRLKSLLSKYARNDTIRHRTNVEEGIVVWQVK